VEQAEPDRALKFRITVDDDVGRSPSARPRLAVLSKQTLEAQPFGLSQRDFGGTAVDPVGADPLPVAPRDGVADGRCHGRVLGPGAGRWE
jgi:hypothetical protein